MKKIFIIILFLLLFIFINLYKNQTFFNKLYLNKVVVPKYSYFIKKESKYYDKENIYWKNSINLINFKKINELEEFRKNYIENLTMCYDESYFYDIKYDITYSLYEIEKKNLFNIIKIDYINGNLCENEYILNKKWLENFETVTIMESNIDYNLLIDKLKISNREDNNDILTYDETYYVICLDEKYGYNIYIIKIDETKLGIIFSDQNDMKKYAVYNINENVSEFLKKIKI